jgi:HSP20 family protein
MQMLRVGYAHPLEDLRDEMDRLWTTLTAAPPLHGWTRQTTSEPFPAVNIFETDEAILVEAELPGLEAADLEITAIDDELTLTGRRVETIEPAATADTTSEAVDEQPKKITWHRRERGVGNFERRLSLPTAVDPEGVEARLLGGVLTVTCPKAAACRPHKVAVTAN